MIIFKRLKRKIPKRLKKNIRKLMGLPSGNPILNERIGTANKYIRGNGIEIGALHNPLEIPKLAKVKYIDRMSASDLRKQYPELNELEIVDVDIISNGDNLENIQDGTQDFVIAVHVIEHCENPIAAIGNMLRVLKTEGILYLVIPDKRYTFDVDRPVTPIEHILKDYKDGPEWSKKQHFEEWAKLVDKKDDSEIEKYVDSLIESDYSIHYHVWTPDEILEIIINLKKVLFFKFEVELFVQNDSEVISILRKTEDGYQHKAEQFVSRALGAPN